MASIHEIGIGADTGPFEKGIRQGIIKPLEDTDKTLDDLGRNSGPDQLEQSLKDVQGQAGKTERSVDDIGDSGKKGFGKAGDAAGEFKSEALANLSEVTSSFDGSIESVGDLVQGTFGGLASSLPGALGIGGAALAAAVGVTTAAFQKAGQAADDAKASAYEYGLTVAQSGEYANAAQRINDLTGSVEGLKKVQDIATVSGMNQADVVKALATGDGLPALAKAFDKGASSSTIATGRVLELQGALDGTKQGFDLSSDAAKINASALYDLAKKAGTATDEIDDLGNKVVTMPDGKKVVIDAETKQAYEDVDAFEKQQIKPKTVKVTADTSEYDATVKRMQKAGITVEVTPKVYNSNTRQLMK